MGEEFDDEEWSENFPVLLTFQDHLANDQTCEISSLIDLSG